MSHLSSLIIGTLIGSLLSLMFQQDSIYLAIKDLTRTLDSRVICLPVSKPRRPEP